MSNSLNSDLIHREQFGSVAFFWARDRARATKHAKRCLDEWLLETKHERLSWKSGIVVAATRRKNQTRFFFAQLIESFTMCAGRRMDVEARISEIERNRCITIYVTAFVAWRHCVRKLSAERARSDAVLRRRTFRVLRCWVKAFGLRRSRITAWDMLVRGRRRLAILESGRDRSEKSTCLHASQVGLKSLITSKVFDKWKQRKHSESVSRQLTSRYFSFWRKRLFFDQKRRDRRRTLFFCEWFKLFSAAVVHKSRLRIKTLSGLYQEVSGKYMLWAFSRWLDYMRAEKQAVVRVILIRSIKAWSGRTKQNSDLTRLSHEIRMKRFRNIFALIVRQFRLLSSADRWCQLSTRRFVLRTWFRWKYIDSPRQERLRDWIRRKQGKKCVSIFMLKWVAMASCTHMGTIRQYMTKKRCYLRWVAYTLRRRNKTKQFNLAHDHYTSGLKKKAQKSLLSHCRSIQYRDTVTVPELRASWLVRSLWQVWQYRFRPILQRENLELKKIQRFRRKKLIEKSFRILIIHRRERHARRLEISQDRSQYGKRARVVYWSHLRSGLDRTRNRGKLIRVITLKRIDQFLGNWLRMTQERVARKRQFELNTKVMTFQVLRKMKKNNSKIFRNLLFKFFDKWVQYFCSQLIAKRLAKWVQRRLQTSSFTGWLSLERCINKGRGNESVLRSIVRGWHAVRLKHAYMNACVSQISRSLCRRSWILMSQARDDKIRILAHKVDRIRQQLIHLRE